MTYHQCEYRRNQGERWERANTIAVQMAQSVGHQARVRVVVENLDGHPKVGPWRYLRGGGR